MSRDSNGDYTLPAGVNPVVAATTITDDWANTTLADVATALTDSWDRQGRGAPLANLSMGSFKFTSMAAGSASTDSIRYGQALNQDTATIASASTVDLAGATATDISVTGTTTITSFGTGAAAGVRKFVTFASALTLTHSSTLLCPNSTNLAVTAGSTVIARSEGSNVWRVQNEATQAVSSLSFGGTDKLTAAASTLTATVPFVLPAGSSSAPALSYYINGSTDPGVHFATTNAVTLQGDGAAATLTVDAADVTARSNVNGGTTLYAINTSTAADPDSIAHFQTYRNADSSYDVLKVTCDADGTPNLIWRVRGDGATFADGAYSGSGADYAEAFLFTGPEPRPGDPVALDGDRVRIAVGGDDIIGVVSERACAVGDAKLLEQGGVPVGLVGKLRVNPGRPIRPEWRLLSGNLYLVK